MPQTYLVPPTPPHNEGKTPAAWTLSVLVVLGVLGISLGMITGQILFVWVGIAVIIVGLITGFAMRSMGLGQKKKA